MRYKINDMISNIWSLLDQLIRVFLIKILKLNLKEDRIISIVQFAKFCVVGVLNNIVYYSVYLILIYLGVYYIISNVVGLTVSVINAYYFNNRYVFGTDGKLSWWKKLLKTYISYLFTGVLLSNLLLILWIEFFHVSEVIAPILDLMITVPINFLINKFWTYKKKQK